MLKRERTSRVTLTDVARRADVSPVTVSRVLRDPAKVSERLRARVLAAVRELAYVPNQLASALASSRTGRVAVIVPSLSNGVFDEYLCAAYDMFVPAGIEVVVLSSNYTPGREERAIVTALGQHPEAVILAGADQTPLAKKSLQQARIPVVQTMEMSPDPIDINIGLSHFDAGYAAARHLFDLGHRNVGYVAAPLDSRARTRLAGYLHAVQEFGGAPAIASVDEPSSVMLGGKLFVQLVARMPAMTAVFCANDNLALGALFECQRRRIAVPDDLSIIGFNDLEFSACACPSLSTVATPRYEMARRAAEIILEIIRGAGRQPKHRQMDLGFRLVQRESTSERVESRAILARS
jgi:LacI family transcriptional regulator, gluconate utilization system Gnt-I transcriptional repressor